MPRPKANPEQYLQAYRLWRKGKGHKEIYEVLEGEFYPSVSERTISNWIQGFKKLHPETVDLDSPFEWREMARHGLPWEASSFIMDMLKDAYYSRAGYTQSGLNNVVLSTTTTVRDVLWWWRVHQAAPEIPEGVGTLRDIQQLAAQFTFREMTHELLATPMETADLEARLALKPWLDADHHRRYHWAADLGVIPAIARPESAEISRVIVATVDKPDDLKGWMDGGSFGILEDHLELLPSQQIALAQVHQKVFMGEQITNDEIEKALWGSNTSEGK
jgi:hypothetical protein